MTIHALDITPAGLERVTAWLAKVAPGLPPLPVVADLLDELLPLAQAGEPLRYRLPDGVAGQGAEVELAVGVDLVAVGAAH